MVWVYIVAWVCTLACTGVEVCSVALPLACIEVLSMKQAELSEPRTPGLVLHSSLQALWVTRTPRLPPALALCSQLEEPQGSRTPLPPLVPHSLLMVLGASCTDHLCFSPAFSAFL